ADGAEAAGIAGRGRADRMLRDAISRTDVDGGQIQREGAAHARCAAEPQLPAQQMRQLSADGETEARATVLARGTGVGLLEGLEDDALFLRRDADARIAH